VPSSAASYSASGVICVVIWMTAEEDFEPPTRIMMQRFILENQGSIGRKLVKPGSKDQRLSSVLSNGNAAMPPMTKTSMVAKESLLRLLNLGRLLGNC